MGIFDFLKSVGRKTEGEPAVDIKAQVEQALAGRVDPLYVTVNEDGGVSLGGMATDRDSWEKAILLAGNVEGVASVDSTHLHFPAPEPEPRFYTIQSGDSLSKIAKEVYGDASKWQTLFEANREVIENPDLIYPGQQIRIPEEL